MGWCGVHGFHWGLVLGSMGSEGRLDTLDAHGNIPAKKQSAGWFLIVLTNLYRKIQHRTKMKQMQENLTDSLDFFWYHMIPGQFELEIQA